VGKPKRSGDLMLTMQEVYLLRIKSCAQRPAFASSAKRLRPTNEFYGTNYLTTGGFVLNRSEVECESQKFNDREATKG